MPSSENEASEMVVITMHVYKSETQEVIRRFLEDRISFRDCICALDAALAGLIPSLECDQLVPLRELMLANHETVMKEMERRTPPATKGSTP